MKASESLMLAAETHKERSKIYGDGYKHFGAVVKAFFPNGINIEDENDMTRYGLFHMMMSKMHRYSINFMSGGHEDSLIDLSAYAAMLNEIDTVHKTPHKRVSLCTVLECSRQFDIHDQECIDCMATARTK